MWASGTATLPALTVNADSRGVTAAAYPANTKIEAACKTDLMLERVDREGQSVWLRIRCAIVALQAPTAGPPN